MSNQTANDSAEMTFGEHLDELRKILIRVALVFSLLFIVFFILKGAVLEIVFAPVTPEFPTNRLFGWMAAAMNSDALNIHPENVELFNNKMAGQFMLHIKSSLVGAIVVAFPFLIWQLWLFVKPALPPHQRRQSIRYVLETPVWFILGLLFGYYVIAPLAINFLGNYSVSDEISNIIDVGSYMSTVLGVSFAAALAFQLPLLIRLLATIGIIGSDSMRQYRKVAVVVLLVFAAVITPPDIVSQILIFLPCYALYEYGIVIAQRIEARRAKEEAEYLARQKADGNGGDDDDHPDGDGGGSGAGAAADSAGNTAAEASPAGDTPAARSDTAERQERDALTGAAAETGGHTSQSAETAAETAAEAAGDTASAKEMHETTDTHETEAYDGDTVPDNKTDVGSKARDNEAETKEAGGNGGHDNGAGASLSDGSAKTERRGASRRGKSSGKRSGSKKGSTAGTARGDASDAETK